MFKKYVLPVVLFALLLTSLQASDLEETLQSLSQDAGRSYVNPMVSAFGSDMNSGWFHKVPQAVISAWSFEVGIVAMCTLFIEDDKYFDVNGKFSFTRAQAEELAQDFADESFFNDLVNQIMLQEFELGITGPTVIGPSYDEADDDTAIQVHFDQQTITFTYEGETMQRELPAQSVKIPFGGLLDAYPAMPLAMPQLTIGTVYGTQASFRYLPEIVTVKEIGAVSYLGYGLQHNPAVWFTEPLPFDIALAYFAQKVEIGSIVEADAYNYGINVAKTFGEKLIHVTPYLGFSIEKSKMHFRYDYQTGSTTNQIPEVINIDFNVDGKNKNKFTTGLSLRLGLLNFNADVNFAKYPSASAGLALNFSW
ncbi:MAG: DUF6588 family protein [Candidatus Cloacimonadaceae bacterium]